MMEFKIFLNFISLKSILMNRNLYKNKVFLFIL